MAYTPFNKYRRILKVQEIYKQYSIQGVTAEYIYRNYIAAQFDISKRTFYNYLSTPASAELKRAGLPVQQMTLAL